MEHEEMVENAKGICSRCGSEGYNNSKCETCFIVQLTIFLSAKERMEKCKAK